jgi:uncharacterized membrane protein SirB2
MTLKVLYRELYLTSYLFLWLGIAYFLVSPFYFETGFYNFFDIGVRTNINEPFLGTYYFWWTNLFYLPTFFTVLAFIALYLKSNSHLRKTLLIIIPIIVIYIVEVSDAQALNNLELTAFYTTQGLNILLTNTLNKYHPFIFYLSSTAIFLIWAYRPFLVSKPFLSAFFIKLFPDYVYIYIILNLWSLWMGSWWALQEGTWGGWWNWDSSEMFGLLISLTLLSIVHSSATNRNLSWLYVKFQYFTIYIILSYFFIQLNFELASHNFGAKFFFFFNNNLFFLEVISTFLLIFCIVFVQSLKVANISPGFNPRWKLDKWHYAYLLRLLPSILVFYWVLWSYKPLFNFFLWNFIELNVLNTEFSLQPTNFLLGLIILYTLKTYYLPSRFPYSPYLMILNNVVWLPTLTSIVSLRVVSLHTALLLFTLLNLTVYNLTVNYWFPKTSYMYVPLGKSIEFENLNSYTLDGGSYEVSVIWKNLSDITSISWNLYSLTNTPSINFFSLELSHATLQNIYNLGGVYITSNLLLELPLLGTLNSIALLIFYRFYLFYNPQLSKINL